MSLKCRIRHQTRGIARRHLVLEVDRNQFFRSRPKPKPNTKFVTYLTEIVRCHTKLSVIGRFDRRMSHISDTRPLNPLAYCCK